MRGGWNPSRSTQRLLARSAVAVGVIAWSLVFRRPPGWVVASAVAAVFLVNSAVLWVREGAAGRDRKDPETNALPEIVSAGLIVAFTGGVTSEFDALFYLLIAVRAPFTSARWSIALPALASLSYAAAVWPAWSGEGLGRAAVHVGTFWVLAPLLRGISARAREDREHAERLAATLSTTHQEVRRYTAALEKANADSERRLVQITLLHRFLHDVRKERGSEAVYRTVLSTLAQAGEVPWVVLIHRQKSDQERPVLRTWGDPPGELTEWGRKGALGGACGRNGDRFSVEREDDSITAQAFSRCGDDGFSVVAALGFPSGHPSLDKGQVETISALMDSVALELELVRLETVLSDANAQLAESNRNLVRLQELQAELSRSFFDSERTEDVVHGIQEIMAKELFELDRLNLFLPDPQTGMLKCRTSVGIGHYPLEQIQVPLDERGGAISKSFREGRTIFFDGKGPVPAELRLAYPYSHIPAIRSKVFVIVPIVDHEGRVLGVIGADRKHSLRPIPPQTVKMLEFFARHLALVLAAKKPPNGQAPEPAAEKAADWQKGG